MEIPILVTLDSLSTTWLFVDSYNFHVSEFGRELMEKFMGRRIEESED